MNSIRLGLTMGLLLVAMIAFTGCEISNAEDPGIRDAAIEGLQKAFDAGADGVVEFGNNFTQTATDGEGNGTVSYVSSDPSVASIDSDTGTATALKVGVTVITATKAAVVTPDGGILPQIDSYTLHVVRAPQTIAFNITSIDKNYTDPAFQEQAALVGAGGDGAITYKSSDDNIATVDNNGNINLRNSGTVVITATKAQSANHLIATDAYILNSLEVGGLCHETAPLYDCGIVCDQ